MKKLSIIAVALVLGAVLAIAPVAADTTGPYRIAYSSMVSSADTQYQPELLQECPACFDENREIRIKYRLSLFDLRVKTAAEVITVFESYGYPMEKSRDIHSDLAAMRPALEEALWSGDRENIRAVYEVIGGLWEDLRKAVGDAVGIVGTRALTDDII